MRDLGTSDAAGRRMLRIRSALPAGVGRMLGVIAVGLGLQGCAIATIAVVGTVVGAGAGVGIDVAVEQTLSGIVYKTFAAPADDVHRATLDALRRMAIPVTTDQQDAGGNWTLAASAADRAIAIRLERLTAGTTRLRVVVSEGGIYFKDRATATAIVTETANALHDQTGSQPIRP